MCVMGSSLRQVTDSPTFTEVVEGLNVSELRLITGPVGADVAIAGATGADSVVALQPARPPAAMSSAAAPRIVCGVRVDSLQYPRQLFG